MFLTFVLLHLLSVERFTARTFLLVGLLQGLIIVTNQVYVILGVVVFYVVIRRRSELDLREDVVRYVAACSAVVAAAYGAVLALVVHPDTVGEALRWARGISTSHRVGLPGASTIPKTVFGVARAIFGGHFLFGLDSVREKIADHYPTKSLDDEAFLVRGLASWVVTVLIVLVLAALAAMGYLGLSAARGRAAVSGASRRVLHLLGAWLVVFGAFFIVWEPDNPEFWIPQVSVMWLMLSVVLDAVALTRPERRRHQLAALGVAVVAVALVSCIGSVLPARDRANDIYAMRFQPLAEVLSSGDLVVTDNPQIGSGYTLHLTAAFPVAARPLDKTWDGVPRVGKEPSDIVGAVRRALAAGHTVAIDGRLQRSPSGPEAARVGHALAAEFSVRWTRFRLADGVTWLMLGASTQALRSGRFAH